MDRHERNSSGYIEDRVRDYLACLEPAQCKDLWPSPCMITSSYPAHKTIPMKMQWLVRGDSKNLLLKAFYEYLCCTVDDPSDVLAIHPWFRGDNTTTATTTTAAAAAAAAAA